MDKKQAEALRAMWDGNPWCSHEEQIPPLVVNRNGPLAGPDTDPRDGSCEDVLTLYVELI